MQVETSERNPTGDSKRAARGDVLIRCANGVSICRGGFTSSAGAESERDGCVQQASRELSHCRVRRWRMMKRTAAANGLVHQRNDVELVVSRYRIAGCEFEFHSTRRVHASSFIEELALIHLGERHRGHRYYFPSFFFLLLLFSSFFAFSRSDFSIVHPRCS